MSKHMLPPNEYCGDKAMEEYLKKAGSKLSLHEVYGLLYGIITAPNMVMPSKITSLIFSEQGTELESMEKARELYGNLMSLWNKIAGWKPDSEPFFSPDIEYTDNYDGLKQRIQDDSSLIQYLIKGLDLGGTEESDFSEDGLKALKSLSETNAILLKYRELFETDAAEGDAVLKKTIGLIDQLEAVVADCMARVNLGLKEARMRVIEEMRRFANIPRETYQSKSTKIPKNNPCPCGSGKKYKKCCGLIQ